MAGAALLEILWGALPGIMATPEAAQQVASAALLMVASLMAERSLEESAALATNGLTQTSMAAQPVAQSDRAAVGAVEAAAVRPVGMPGVMAAVVPGHLGVVCIRRVPVQAAS